jgi:hypothetical protein
MITTFGVYAEFGSGMVARAHGLKANFETGSLAPFLLSADLSAWHRHIEDCGDMRASPAQLVLIYSPCPKNPSFDTTPLLRPSTPARQGEVMKRVFSSKSPPPAPYNMSSTSLGCSLDRSCETLSFAP